jgi:hypothetical protein
VGFLKGPVCCVLVMTVSPTPCPRSFRDLEADPLLQALGWDLSGLQPIPYINYIRNNSIMLHLNYYIITCVGQILQITSNSFLRSQ